LIFVINNGILKSKKIGEHLKMDDFKDNIIDEDDNDTIENTEKVTLEDIPRLAQEWHEELAKDPEWDEIDRECVINVETLEYLLKLDYGFEKPTYIPIEECVREWEEMHGTKLSVNSELDEFE
jgi:hypothetical protein